MLRRDAGNDEKEQADFEDGFHFTMAAKLVDKSFEWRI